MADTDTDQSSTESSERHPYEGAQLRIAFPSPDEGQEVSGETVCGTCGEEIRGKVYFNRLGPCHRMCAPVA